MRLVQSAFAVLLLGVPVAACTIDARGDCSKNPLACAPVPCTSPSDCPEPADRCKERACTAGSCDQVSRDCGALSCNPQSGRCEGCVVGDPDRGCRAKECQQVSCNRSVCDESPAADMTPCADGNGDCHAGACEILDGKPCAPGLACHSGVCAGGVCCDHECSGPCMACNLAGSEGACSPLPAGSPDPSCDGRGGCGAVEGHCACDDGELNGDESDVDCGGACGATCTIGRKCGVDGDCESQHCADGVCCNTPCKGPCVACDLHPGLCSYAAAGTNDEKCVLPNVCTVDAKCLLANDNDSDVNPCSADSHCASNRCNVQTGKCEPCSPGGCGATLVCESGICLNKAVEGEGCQIDAECESGSCVDGVCCNEKCDGVCMGCHEDYTGDVTGKCAAISDGLDPQGECAYLGAGATCDGRGSCATP